MWSHHFVFNKIVTRLIKCLVEVSDSKMLQEEYLFANCFIKEIRLKYGDCYAIELRLFTHK